MSKPVTVTDSTYQQEVIESDKPVVAAVQGAVAGGGLGLMLTADYIVAAERAKFVRAPSMRSSWTTPVTRRFASASPRTMIRPRR